MNPLLILQTVGTFSFLFIYFLKFLHVLMCFLQNLILLFP